MTPSRPTLTLVLLALGAVGCERGAAGPSAPSHDHQPGAPAKPAPTPPPPAAGDHAAHGAGPAASGAASGAPPAAPELPGYAAVDVAPARQQLLGITTLPVRRERIEKKIRTLGVVQADETRTSHVHVKFEGFIEQIYVNYTGRLVRKGQPLFKVYSRDLLAAQQEYLASRAATARTPSGIDPSVRAAGDQLANAARDRLRLFDVPASALAQIERTGEAQRAITITSPQNGTVIEKQALEGLAVTPMTPLYVIADLSRVWVLADIYERDTAQVQLGQSATLRLEGLPGRTFEGKTTFVSPVVDQTTRTTKVRFEFPNREGALRPGMYATVDLSAAVGEGLAVPSDAVIDTGERKIVFVARGQGRFEPRAIVTGLAFDGKYEVLEGLAQDEAIAASGQFLLDSESRIRGARTGGPGHGAH
jgi:membrane fusion protein, copper/silver efflux system